MSKMYKCDRCGKKFSDIDITNNYYLPSKIYHGDIHYSRKNLEREDYCPDCSLSLMKWKDAKKEKRWKRIHKGAKDTNEQSEE